MNEEKIIAIVNAQRTYFNTGATLSISSRIEILSKLKATIQKYEIDIEDALQKDLGKSRTESYMCEIGMVYSELNYMLKHIKKFAKKKHAHTPLAQMVAKSYVIPSPFGVCLIMSPWNYPFMLSFDPLIDALAAGNTIVLKPSAYAPFTCRIIKTIIEETFPSELVSFVDGGRAENQALLKQNFDKIFFTGSKQVGQLVLESASEHLTPVTLELGGKSPCIIDETANLKMAAKRIIFGKFLNCGQTCVAPDYILCQKSQIEQLLPLLRDEIIKQFTNNPLSLPEYGKIINTKHFNRLNNLLNASHIYYGGEIDNDALKIAPAIIYPCQKDDLIMQEEIFGPLLPILIYDNLDEAVKGINHSPTPLAFYIFSSNNNHIDYVLNHAHFGGAAVNETITHLATSNMGFGGLKESGMGAYHGKTGFDEFTHYKSVINKATWFDLSIRYQPYTKIKKKFIKSFLK